MVGWNALHSNDVQLLVRVVRPTQYEDIEVGQEGVATLEVVWREAWTRTWHKRYWVQFPEFRFQYLFHPDDLNFVN
jgi:hypothetical protein